MAETLRFDASSLVLGRELFDEVLKQIGLHLPTVGGAEIRLRKDELVTMEVRIALDQNAVSVFRTLEFIGVRRSPSGRLAQTLCGVPIDQALKDEGVRQALRHLLDMRGENPEIWEVLRDG
jgi:hypothetical protein